MNSDRENVPTGQVDSVEASASAECPRQVSSMASQKRMGLCPPFSVKPYHGYRCVVDARGTVAVFGATEETARAWCGQGN